MRLDRNLKIGRGKYALIRLRNSGVVATVECAGEQCGIIPLHAIDFGNSDDSDFFVIRLKDKYAAPALMAYADAAQCDDAEWANEVRELARKAEHHPNKALPS
jgi:hypothetical protein